MRAEVVKAKLEAYGIPALLKYESVGQIFGITVDGIGRVEVHVPAELEEQALDLIAEGDAEGDQTSRPRKMRLTVNRHNGSRSAQKAEREASRMTGAHGC